MEPRRLKEGGERNQISPRYRSLFNGYARVAGIAALTGYAHFCYRKNCVNYHSLIAPLLIQADGRRVDASLHCNYAGGVLDRFFCIMAGIGSPFSAIHPLPDALTQKPYISLSNSTSSPRFRGGVTIRDTM